MKFLALITLLIGTTGCVTNVNYDLSPHENGTPLKIEVVDARDNVVAKTTYEYATFTIGEEHVTPSPREIVSIKLNKYLSSDTKNNIRSILLTDFQLIISDPQHASILAGAAFAGASYGAGLLVESGLTSYSDKDGVISKVSLKVDQEEFSCIHFVPAYDEIGALVGFRASGKELTVPMNQVIDACIKSISEKINSLY